MSTLLGVNEDFVDFYINDQSAVCNFRAVILFVRRIRTADDAGRIVRISLARGVSPSLHWIFFFSLCFGDRFGWGRPVLNAFTRYTAYARIGALSVKRCAGHKQRNRNR